MDKMKARFCPECGSEINFKDNDFNNCPKLDCELNAAILSREYWGRIRIAPDDEKVYDWKGCSKNWMQPRYPDETKEGE